MKYIVVLIITLSFTSLGLAQEGGFINKLTENASSYGIVIGDEIEVINEVTLDDNSITISYKSSGGSSAIQGKYDSEKNVLRISEKSQLSFNNDGTAKGKTEEGQDVFILIGDKSTDRKVISDLGVMGLQAKASDMVFKQKLPGHDAPVWFYHKSDDYLQISFVFPVGFVHPAYGPQSHVRIWKFQKTNGVWNIEEDNSSVNQ